MNKSKDVESWLNTGDYLPEMLKDFHDQKDLFKSMHLLYGSNNSNSSMRSVPSWIDGHTYTIDCFLWYMAGRGYTLQKSRAKIDFYEFENPDDLKEKKGI